MIELVLPDGTRRTARAGVTPLELAREIGPGLAKAAVAAQLDGCLVDLRAPLARGGSLRLVTTRDPEAGPVIRHSAEHVMADAVKRLWPGTEIDVGRSDHQEKFQYDFLIPARVTPDDFERIEAEMRRIVESGVPFEREVVTRSEARERLAARGERLKLARLDDIPAGEEITLYRHGEFVDLCRGPHVQHARQIGAFKLTEVSGSYWKGDESNPMLQRIYGIAFASQQELDQHLHALEEARARDHRRLGQQLELFMFHEWAPGAPFYLPKGQRLLNGLFDYLRGLYRRYGYQEVSAPLLFDIEMFRVSGHLEMFPDMYKLPGESGEQVGVKPMNCPGHCLIFQSGRRSYRELPLRLAEFSRLHRNERSGTLHGLTRVRAMSQDDAHVFCEPAQVPGELDRALEMMSEVYRDLGVSGVEVRIATRPERSIGDPADWARGERMLSEAVERAGHAFRIAEGEGAFYGPKIECHFRDALGRGWQLSTFQLDMAMPQRFGLTYVGADGAEHVPAMMHRAILGSLERFLGVYLEHTAGDLPLWLAPVQAAIIPITDRCEGWARKVASVLGEAGLRVEVDARSETLGYRIRSAELAKIPYVLVVGDRETAEGAVNVRRRHDPSRITLGVDALRNRMEEEVRARGLS